jgi:hypothetical protein
MSEKKTIGKEEVGNNGTVTPDPLPARERGKESPFPVPGENRDGGTGIQTKLICQVPPVYRPV